MSQQGGASGTTERERWAFNGFVMLAVVLVASLVAFGLLVSGNAGAAVMGLILGLAAMVSLAGFFVLQPNMAVVVTFFGRYVGSFRRDGFWWTNPLALRKSISLRITTLDSDVLKVNDAVGNPVEIAAVITWQVVETARAVFDVEDYDSFVRIQTETAVRHVASEYPYDDYEQGEASLRANADDVTQTLQVELQERLNSAGVQVIDTRLRRLAYAPEIAQEMLRRQQANAVVAARQRIVEGAVGMVHMALDMLSTQDIVQLDEERKAALVSNLLVVLCSDRGTQPVLSAGAPTA